MERLSQGIIDEEQFERLSRGHLAQKRQWRERLAALEAEERRAGEVELTLGEVSRALERFPEMWEALSGEERRELRRSLVESLSLTPEALTVKLLFLPEVRIPLAAGSKRGELRRQPQPESSGAGRRPSC